MADFSFIYSELVSSSLSSSLFYLFMLIFVDGLLSWMLMSYILCLLIYK